MRFRLDDLEIDLSRQTVERDRKLLDVRGISFQLLAFLLQQGTRVTRFDELIEAVWAPAVVNEETVTQRVRLLRAALQDDGRKPRYIRSVRGQGYQLCAEPELVNAVPVERAGLRKQPVLMLAAIAAAFIVFTVLAFQHEPLAPTGTRDSGEVARLIERANYYASIGQADNNRRAIALYRQALAAQPGNISVTLSLSAALSAATCQFDAAPDAAVEAGELAGAVLADAPDMAGAAADPLDGSTGRDTGWDHRLRRDQHRGGEVAPGTEAVAAVAPGMNERKVPTAGFHLAIFFLSYTLITSCGRPTPRRISQRRFSFPSTGNFASCFAENASRFF